MSRFCYLLPRHPTKEHHGERCRGGVADLSGDLYALEIGNTERAHPLMLAIAAHADEIMEHLRNAREADQLLSSIEKVKFNLEIEMVRAQARIVEQEESRKESKPS